MKSQVLHVLRADAARWWWRHRALRQSDDVEAARRLERESVLSSVRHLRAATTNPSAYVSIYSGVTMLHIGSTTVSLYAPLERFPLAAVAVALGTPLVDLRPVEDVIALANLPRVTTDGTIDPEPWGKGSKVPLIAYLDAVERLGVKIANDPRRTHAT